MTINNFEQIRDLLKFPTENSFYFLEIIKRRKENPDLKNHARLIKNYYVYNFEQFDELQPEIIDLCNYHNARAYFRLNLRDAKKIAFLFNKRVAELLITEDYKNVSRVYSSIAGEFMHDEDKKWQLDFDEPLGSLLVEAVAEITNLRYDAKQKGYPIIADIPTKNGRHVITRPFRLDTFRAKFPTVEVSKDANTVLYQP